MKFQLHKVLEVRLAYEFKNIINLIKTKRLQKCADIKAFSQKQAKMFSFTFQTVSKSKHKTYSRQNFQPF